MLINIKELDLQNNSLMIEQVQEIKKKIWLQSKQTEQNL